MDWNTGAVRTVEWEGRTVCSGLAFLGRGATWDTMHTLLAEEPRVVQNDSDGEDGWTLSYQSKLVAASPAGHLDLTVTMSSTLGSDGLPELAVDAVCTPTTDVVVSRVGFVAMHPSALAGHAVRVTHADGTDELTAFPTLIAPDQPVRSIRALAHAVDGTTLLEMRFEGGDSEWEMEDQRQWCDASFKTYVRPLALPVPYTVESGESIHQRTVLSFQRGTGLGPGPAWSRPTANDVVVSIRPPVHVRRVPPVCVGVPCGGELGPSLIAAAERGDDPGSKTRDRRDSGGAASVVGTPPVAGTPPIAATLSGEGAAALMSSRVAGAGSASGSTSTVIIDQVVLGATGDAAAGAAGGGGGAGPAVGVLSPEPPAGGSAAPTGQDGISFSLCDSIRGVGCKLLNVRFNRADGHGVGDLRLYKRLAEKTDTALVIEVVFHSTASLGDHIVRQEVRSQAAVFSSCFRRAWC